MSEADTREPVALDIPDDVLFSLMLAAHERDITLNQMVEVILREQLEKEQIHVYRD
jgi:hypothetical protein